MISRRQFIGMAGGLWLCGLPDGVLAGTGSLGSAQPFPGAKLWGNIPFLDTPGVPADLPLGTGLDGRLYTDLEHVDPRKRIVPIGDFYIRTRASSELPAAAGWTIQVGGKVKKPKSLPISLFHTHQAPLGEHLLECSGNTSAGGFRMLSAATWGGVPLSTVLAWMDPEPDATHLLVSGFDQYPEPSSTSIPGASWIFPIHTPGALAVRMNGQPLPPDHGSPIRLLMPGWYGCSNIKWVNELRAVTADEPTTSQMREYASRTHQTGVPARVRDYRLATMDVAAMPIRLEQWRVGSHSLYRLVGIVWGGAHPASRLLIRTADEGHFVPVDQYVPPATTQTWSFWYHHFKPSQAGTYRIQLTAPGFVTRRMDKGFYARSVLVTEV